MVWLLFHDVQVGASGLRAGERLEEALLEFSAAIALQPRYGKALANRANLLSATGRYAEAMADANMAAEAMPEMPQLQQLVSDMRRKAHAAGQLQEL